MIKIKIISFAFFIFCNAPAAASVSSEGRVTEIVANPTSSGSFSFAQNGNRTTPPSCAAATPTRWVLDVSTDNGKAAAATVLTAFSQGKKIYVQGTGMCPASQADIESVFFLAIS